MNMICLLKCIFNKCWGALGSFRSWISVEDDEYVYLQILFRVLSLGIPISRRTSLRNVDFAWQENCVESVHSYLGKGVQESSLFVVLLGIHQRL